jgi:PqqA peptide cyclase
VSGIAPPLGLLAELTHRCPLRCVYCSNPLALAPRTAELDTGTWARVFEQAVALGVLHVHLSGGEPARRGDIVALTRAAAQAGLYSNLITSGIGVTAELLADLAAAGLDHVQLSLQDTNSTAGDRAAGREGAQVEKRQVARAIGEAGLPLTINAVLHRDNADRAADLLTEAVELGARRIELAHTQFLGWAGLNREALLPSRAQVERVADIVERARQSYASTIVIDYVAPDHFVSRPKPCVNGWGRELMVVTPTGRVLPCHAAETIPDLEFWNVVDHALSDIWYASPAFEAFRGTAWMKEPCISCPRKTIDYGGCRCQALALTGDARNTDPTCALSPYHGRVLELTAGEAPTLSQVIYREFRAPRSRPVRHGTKQTKEAAMSHKTKKTDKQTPDADDVRKDKSDKDVEKFEDSKGVDYQVTIDNGGEARDAIKQDRG